MTVSSRWPHPIVVALNEVPVTVVGAGAVAEPRIETLLAGGARVTVVGPNPTPSIDALAAQSRVTLRRRSYEAGDLDGARLAYAASSRPEVNRAVRVEAMAAGVWLDMVDHADSRHLVAPAIVRRGDLTISVSAKGSGTSLTKQVCGDLERQFAPVYPAVAVPAYAEAPPTPREPFTATPAFLGGHEPPANPVPFDGGRYARTSASLVIFIGVHNLPTVARLLLEHGRDPGSPVAVIGNGTTEAPRTVVAPLVRVADVARQAGILPPALIVVGDVVPMPEKLAWRGEGPRDRPACRGRAEARSHP